MRLLTPLLVALLTVFGAPAVRAADQTVLGQSFVVKDPAPGGDSSLHTVVVLGLELTSDNTIAGNPLASGATVEIIANGARSTVQVFTLPPGASVAGSPGWKALGHPVIGYSYKDALGLNGPVKAALIIKKANGTFVVKVTALGALGPGPQPHITVVPPAPGTDGGMRFVINGGDTYCVAFGGAAGGAVTNAPTSGTPNKVFKVVSKPTTPTNETAGCPSPPPTTTTSMTSTTSTTSTSRSSTSTTTTTSTSTSRSTASSTSVTTSSSSSTAMSTMVTTSTSPSSTTTTTIDPNGPSSLDLVLSTSIAPSGASLMFTTTVRNAAGDPIVPPPPITVVVAPVGTPLGPTPTVVGNTITVDATTAGTFAIMSQVVGSISDTELLTVVAPLEQSQPLTDLSHRMNTGAKALADAAHALRGGDGVAASAAKADLEAATGGIDLAELAFTAPLSPPDGFLPSPGQVVAAGHPPTAADGGYAATLASIISAYDGIIAAVNGVDPGNVTNAEITDLRARASHLGSLLDQLRGIQPSLYGVVANVNGLTLLLSRRIPMLTRLVGEKAAASLAAVGVAQAAPPLESRLLALLTPRAAYAQFLFDVLSAIGVEGTLADLSQAVYGRFIMDAENMVILLGLEHLLQGFTGGGLCQAVSGASLSFIRPDAPGSFLEGTGFNPFAADNEVLFIGPEAPQAVRSIINLFNAADIHKPNDIYKFLKSIKSAYGAVGNLFAHADRSPSSIAQGAGFICTDFGDQLLFDGGFPDVLGSCSICISPVLILHYDVANGPLSMITVDMVR